ncbi:hypothetical protein CC1G_04497 [Coprinopsis cinerea okayama7|uniref:Uncharacterized protein n=1 Tax=Coprinopsis cinerea (strain Okayama-7 / 130 / ATCC MYA-4618 / FGSC 9003) TaxID=240176 RepID=A8N5B9_COPC7|nr:hypothetical protein CC1G_04497 [Coprinopsis cinerea okayama7\|eukprot:XP_001830064.2 hypothetical protein CC1G_04497 [Coprinopsis cinerea okayama7\
MAETAAPVMATPAVETTTTMQASAPVPLSFPAILRNPGITSRFAHLTGETGERQRKSPKTSSFKKHRRDQNDGKRWVRRKDNAQFVGNPYIVQATRKDYIIPPPQIKPTFPEPLPPYLPRTVKLPTTPELPPTNPISANAGRFSLSLKGMRKELRRQGGRAESLVVDIERAILIWLVDGGTVLAPGAQEFMGPNAPMMNEGVPVGNNTSIVEVSRTPLQLIWRIPDDAFARYVVHCCARYHEIVSFSKGEAGNRLTYLLRPNVTRPDRRAPAGLDTPPATDIDYSSNPDIDTDSNIDSDFISDRDLDSDVEGAERAGSTNILDSISEREGSLPPDSPHLSPTQDGDEAWSLIGETEADVESSNELEVVEAGVEQLSISQTAGESEIDEEDPDKTFTADNIPQAIRPLHRPYPLGASPRRVIRSSSSPSRSPIRERRRVLGPVMPLTDTPAKRTFYEFVFR